MQDFQQEFIEFALARGVLRFGEFTLKSGRVSPYFFNSGLFNDGSSLERLGCFYARAAKHAGLEFDQLYGPAYKGIPLATAMAIACARLYDRTVPLCFNRKEEKDHGEGGNTLGAPLHGRVLIIDDVITAGTSVNQSVDLIRSAGAEPAAVAIALDRRERGTGPLSAVQEVEQRHDLRVISIITLDDLVQYLGEKGGEEAVLARIRDYRREFGITAGS